MFLLLDYDDVKKDFSGRVFCSASLPARVVDLGSLATDLDAHFLYRFACFFANGDANKDTYYDFSEFLEKVADFFEAKKTDWIDDFARDSALRNPSTVPWASLLEGKLPLCNRARERDFDDSLALLPDKQLRLQARDGSNVFHFFAHRGDPAAIKSLLQRHSLHFLTADRNRAGLFPAAVAAARHHFNCVTLLRPFIAYLQDARLYGNKKHRLNHIRKNQAHLGLVTLK